MRGWASSLMWFTRIWRNQNKATDGTGSYYVFVNADSTERTLTLTEDLTSGTVVVDNDEAEKDAVSSKSGFTLTSNLMTIEPLTAVIIRTDAAAAVLSGLSVDKDSYTLQIGKTHQTAIFANYDDGSKRTVTKQSVYKSSNPQVATVTTAGLVKGIAEGTAEISVSYSGFQKNIMVTISADPVDDIGNVRVYVCRNAEWCDERDHGSEKYRKRQVGSDLLNS